MLATAVEGDEKAPFSIATIPRCWGHTTSPILPSICTLHCWELSKEISSTILKVFGMTQLGIEPRSTGPLATTLLTRPMNNNNNTNNNETLREE